MKKITVMAFVLASLMANAQDVPQKVKDTFSSKFSDVEDIDWEKTAKGYVADFYLDENQIICLIDGSGKWLETKSLIEDSQAPATVKKSILSQFKVSEYSQIYKIDDYQGQKRFEIYFESDTAAYVVLMDAEGKLLSKQVDEFEEMDDEESID